MDYTVWQESHMLIECLLNFFRSVLGSQDEIRVVLHFRSVCKLSLSLSLSAVTHAPFHAPVLRPTSWPNA